MRFLKYFLSKSYRKSMNEKLTSQTIERFHIAEKTMEDIYTKSEDMLLNAILQTQSTAA